MVAYPDKTLDTAVDELKNTYPGSQFRKVGLNLANQEFLDSLIEQTADIDIRYDFTILFCCW